MILRVRFNKMQMKRPVIHGYSCSDHDPIEEWVPENCGEVDIYVDVYLGPDTGPASQFFTFNVVTYGMLKMRQGNFKYICPVYEYSWIGVEDWVSSVLDK